MGTSKKKNYGFSIVELMIVLAVAAILGALGWMAYKNYRATESMSGSNTDSVTQEVSQPSADKTADWTLYTGADDKISLKWPIGWVTAENPELCSEGILLLAPTTESLGTCASEDFGQVSFSWRASDQSCEEFGEDNAITYNDGTVVQTETNRTKKAVTVNGVAGIKRTSVSTGEGPYNSPEGTVSISYCFNTSGYIYIARYIQRDSYPDASSDFETIVMETLRFGRQKL